MNPFLRHATAAFALVTAGLAMGTPGCATNCANGKCTTETTQQYVGTAKSVDVAWSAGQDLVISLPSASVRIGDAATAITVQAGAPGDTQMHVKFTPFTSETAENKQKAIDEMNNNLTMSATSDPGSVNVLAQTSGTHGNALSAWVDIILPAGFNGRIKAEPGNGDVSIKGAAAGVDVDTSLGNVAVVFGGPLTNANTGHVTTGQGDITFDFVGTSDISIQAQSGNEGAVLVPSPLPATWMAAAGNAATSASFTINNGSTTPWKLDSTGFFTSKIQINTHLERSPETNERPRRHPPNAAFFVSLRLKSSMRVSLGSFAGVGENPQTQGAGAGASARAAAIAAS